MSGDESKQRRDGDELPSPSTPEGRPSEEEQQLPEGARIVDGEVLYSKPPPGKRPWWYSPYFWAALAGVITMPLLRPCTRRIPDPPAVIRQLPTWRLIDQNGKAFGSEELRGHVYVVNFFFNSCKTVCPPLMRAMAELQAEIERLKVDVRLVSITVDPENDTPAVLRQVAQKYGAKPGRWTLLTAKDPNVIQELAVKGFLQHTGRQPAGGSGSGAGSGAGATGSGSGTGSGSAGSHGGHGGQPTGASAMAIAHSASMILVDRENRIRGYYKRDKKWGIQEVAHRSVHVILDRRKK